MDNVKELYASNYRQVVPTLRKIAEEIESGEYGEAGLGSFVLESEQGQIVFTMGEDASLAELVLSLQRALHSLVQQTD